KLLNLYLAVFWLFLGGTVLWLYYFGDRDALAPLLAPERVAWAGWLAVALAAYNFVRWWVSRSSEANRRLMAEQQARLDRERRRRDEDGRERNPDFDLGPPKP